MQSRGIDGGTRSDWGKTSVDYSTWRSNYPDRFFHILTALGVGVPAQHILDLGTGVGFLALQFARQGCQVTGVDISAEQITGARNRAVPLGTSAHFLVAPAEDTGLTAASFDVISASQSWLYFDQERATQEVKRLLKPDGVLMLSHFGWLPRDDTIAKATEELVLRHNPKWTGADWSGEIPVVPKWSIGHFRVKAMFFFDEAIPFTRESWRGRIRACRGVGATLGPEEVAAFDREHDVLLSRIAPEAFTIQHRIEAHLFQPV
jgi:SAM-dependent methyltransferase